MDQYFVNEPLIPGPSASLLQLYTASAPLMDAGYTSFASTWLGSTIVCAALAWILYRASSVLVKPTDELMSLLGIDLPSAPILSLAGLKADGFMLHWKPTDQKTSVSYQLTVNGVVVSDLSTQEQSLQVSGLEPAHGYVVRISATNSTGFSDTSQPLWIHTKPAASHDYISSNHADTENISDERTSSGVIVEPYKSLLETLHTNHNPTPMQREHSGSLSQPKRAVNSRRHTQTSMPAADATSSHDLPDSELSIRELTDRLDRVRAEAHQYQGHISMEEEKYQAELDSLNQQLHDVQQLLQDRNNATRKLNQQVAALVTEESTARKSKATVDRQLEKANQERTKMKQDVIKWNKEAADIESRIAQLIQDQQTYKEQTQAKVAQLKESVVAESAKNKVMEEHIRQTVAQIKELEEEKKKLEEDMEDNVENMDQSSLEEEEAWRGRMMELSQRYQQLYTQHHQLRTALTHDAQVLEQWRSFIVTQTQSYQVPQIDVPPPRRNSGRRRTPSLGNNSRRLSFGQYDPSPFGNGLMSGISPNLSVISPFLNIKNGMTLPQESMVMSPIDSEMLLSAVPTSPSAVDTLLPSGLLGDDESRFGDIDEVTRQLSITESPATHNVLPGLGAPETLDNNNQGPSSPASIQSRSPSVFTSPRESSTHLPHFLDNDRRSVRSNTGSGRAISGSGSGTKFASLFHLGRQRNKTTSDEGPFLGSLKSAETQSLPKQDAVEGSEASASGRRRGSHSGPSWVGQMLGRANTSASLEDNKKKRFNMFGMANKTDPWADIGDSRPISTASSENHILPRPSEQTVSRFGWPASSGEFGSQRNSHLGTDWSLASNSAGWTSRLHSRNSSSQYPMALEDSFDGFDVSHGPTQAPIGTRPKSSQADVKAAAAALKLNPAAPSFKIFGRSSGDKKAEKNGKAKDKKSTAPSERDSLKTSLDLGGEEDGSPLNHRRSRDGISISTADNASDSGLRQSLDFSVGSSAAPSEGGDFPKESFFHKLTRKSSAGFSTFANLRPSSKKQSAPSTKDESDAQQTEEELIRVPTATDDKDKGVVGQGNAATGNRFRLRSLRRKKGEKSAPEPDPELDDDGDAAIEDRVKDKKQA